MNFGQKDGDKSDSSNANPADRKNLSNSAEVECEAIELNPCPYLNVV